MESDLVFPGCASVLAVKAAGGSDGVKHADVVGKVAVDALHQILMMQQIAGDHLRARRHIPVRARRPLKLNLP